MQQYHLALVNTVGSTISYANSKRAYWLMESALGNLLSVD